MKHIYTKILTTALVLVFLTSCLDNSPTGGNPPTTGTPNPDTWDLEHLAFLRDGGVGKDGIPALEFPQLVSPEDIGYLDDDELVIVVKTGGDVRAYPHAILDYHEIINDVVDGNEYAVIYCPLTGTGVTWDRFINGQSSTFGVSGFLYNSNIIPYDRSSESNWSQLLGRSVQGPLNTTIPVVVKSIEIPWGMAKENFPEIRVVSEETGHSRNYDAYPYISIYGDYRKDPFLIFPVPFSDPSKRMKERVFGLITDDEVRIYDFEPFTESMDVINDQVDGGSYVIAGSKDDNFIVAFEAISNNSEELTFEACNCLPNIMQDQHGNKYDVWGEVTEGPDAGYQLPAVNGYMGYWFAWYAFYPDLTLYE